MRHFDQVANQVLPDPLLVDIKVLRGNQDTCIECGRPVDASHRTPLGMMPCDPMVWGIRPRPKAACPIVYVPHEQVNATHRVDPGIHAIAAVQHPLELAQQLNFLASLDYPERPESITPTQRFLDVGEDHWYVAFHGGFGGVLGCQVQGYVRVIEMPHRTILHSLYVLPRHRRQGVAARLLDYALDHHTPLNAYDDVTLWTYLIRRAKISFEKSDVTLLPDFDWGYFLRTKIWPRLEGIELLAKSMANDSAEKAQGHAASDAAP